MAKGYGNTGKIKQGPAARYKGLDPKSCNDGRGAPGVAGGLNPTSMVRGNSKTVGHSNAPSGTTYRSGGRKS